MSKTFVAVVVLLCPLVLGACEKEAETYPITGEQCGPDDPVKTLDANDCYVPTGS